MRFSTKKLVFILLFITVVAQKNGFKRIYKCERDTDNLKLVIELIIKEIAMRCNCIVFITDPFYRGFIDARITRVSYFLPRYDIAIRDNEDFLQPRRRIKAMLQHTRAAGCDAHVILIVNGLLASRFLQYAEGERLIDTRGYFLLLYDNRLFRPELHYIWNRIINVVFVRRQSTYKHRSGERVAAERFDLNTVYYPSRERDHMIKYIDTWHNGELRYDSDFYMPKTTNLQGNGLRIMVFEHIPAVTEASREQYEKDVTVSSKALGIEFELIRIIAKAMNFEAKYYAPNNIAKERWGRIGDNDSYTGLLGEAIDGNADFFLGDLHYTTLHLNYLDLSTPYNTECLTFLTPEALTDNSWKLLILPFSWNVWVVVLCTLIISGGAFHLFALLYVRYVSSDIWPTDTTSDRTSNVMYDNMSGLYFFTEAQNSMLYTYGMLLQISLPRLPNAWTLRIFIGWWWIYCIFAAVMYRASMTATLANPVPRVTIDTLAQLTKTSIAVGGWSEESKEFFLASSDPYSQDIGSKFELMESEEDAIELVANGSFCFYENSYFLWHARGKQIFAQKRRENKSEENVSSVGYNLHIMEECVVQMPIALGMEKNSPLKPYVDLWVRRMTEVGLVRKWLSDVMEWSKIIESLQKSESEIALVNLRKLYGAFVALAIGCSIGVVALLGEIIHWRYFVLRDPMYDKYRLDIFYKNGDKSKT